MRVFIECAENLRTVKLVIRFAEDVQGDSSGRCRTRRLEFRLRYRCGVATPRFHFGDIGRRRIPHGSITDSVFWKGDQSSAKKAILADQRAGASGGSGTLQKVRAAMPFAPLSRLS